MRKAILALTAVLLLASFANDAANKTILKDINGTLLESYVVIDNENQTVSFDVDANTTVSSALVDGEFKVFLIENGNSGNTISYTLKIEQSRSLSFDHYFENSYDVASSGELYTSRKLVQGKPKKITEVSEEL